MSDQENEEVAKEFQVYKCSRNSTKVITEVGKVLVFTAFQFITDNEDDIAHLDHMIKSGCVSITKGDSMTSEDLDPMAALKRRIIAEYEANKAEVASVPDFSGKPEEADASAPTAPVSGMTTTAQLAMLAKNANK